MICWFVACRPDDNLAPTEPPTRFEGKDSPQLAQLIGAKLVKVSYLRAVATGIDDAVPFGEVVKISLKNESQQTQIFRIDCGTILRTNNVRFQDLIVTRSLEGNIAPQTEWTGQLEAFSLQLRRHYPYQPAEYNLGNLATGDLRRFIDCYCLRRPISTKANEQIDQTPVQYAIWRIADNITLKQMMTYSRKGNPSVSEIEASEKQARQQGQFTEQLLEDCQITAKFLD